MSLQLDEIKSEIEKALEVLSEMKGTELAAKIRPILYANMDRGRVETFIEGERVRVVEYMWRVVDHFQRFGGVLHQLQIKRLDETWLPVLQQMEKWAYRFLLRKGQPAIATTWENAKECASEAASKLLGAYFPYDTEFDAWARVIVHNVCMKQFRKASKDVPVVEENYDSLEDTLKKLNHPALQGTDSPNDLLGELMEAVDQLTPSRRKIIVMKYFEGMSPAEIAKELGKTVRAVHSLQFRALQDLRKILTKNRDKLNE